MQIEVKNSPEQACLRLNVYEKVRDEVPGIEIQVFREQDNSISIRVHDSDKGTYSLYTLGETIPEPICPCLDLDCLGLCGHPR